MAFLLSIPCFAKRYSYKKLLEEENHERFFNGLVQRGFCDPGFDLGVHLDTAAGIERSQHRRRGLSGSGRQPGRLWAGTLLLCGGD